MCRVGSLTWGKETSVTPGRETLGDLRMGGWRWKTESLMAMIWTVTRRRELRRLELGFWGRGWRSSHKRCTDRWTAPAGSSPSLERLLGTPGDSWGLLGPPGGAGTSWKASSPAHQGPGRHLKYWAPPPGSHASHALLAAPINAQATSPAAIGRYGGGYLAAATRNTSCFSLPGLAAPRSTVHVG